MTVRVINKEVKLTTAATQHAAVVSSRTMFAVRIITVDGIESPDYAIQLPTVSNVNMWSADEIEDFVSILQVAIIECRRLNDNATRESI